MKTTEFGFHPFNHAAAGWFLVRRLVNGDVPEVRMISGFPRVWGGLVGRRLSFTSAVQFRWM